VDDGRVVPESRFGGLGGKRSNIYMPTRSLHDILPKVAARYPTELRDAQLADVDRIAFNIEIALERCAPKPAGEIELCDIGGGIGLFSVGCAASGLKRTVLVDDFATPRIREITDRVFPLHEELGVEIVFRDVVEKGILDIEGTFDIITSFESVEHWHHSPKTVFHQMVQKLKPGGVFLISVPNCVNLRKRIAVPFGRGKWSRMADWYESEKFRGHVREPDVDDLRYIARDLGLTDVRIVGTNWPGLASPNPLIRRLTRVVDKPLRLCPSLCSDLYFSGKAH